MERIEARHAELDEEIARRTEAGWCPIKNATRVDAPHGRGARFLDCGDGARGSAQGSRRARDRLPREEGRARPQFRRRRITTSILAISAPSGAFGRRVISSSSAGASDRRPSSSQKKCG